MVRDEGLECEHVCSRSRSGEHPLVPTVWRPARQPKSQDTYQGLEHRVLLTERDFVSEMVPDLRRLRVVWNDDIEHTQPGWVSLYLDPGQEYAWGSVPFWAYQLQADGITRTIITSKATAIYPVDGCVWILDDTNDGVMDAPIETEDISGLDPCN